MEVTCDGRFVKVVEKDGGGRMDGYGVAGAYASPSGLQPLRVSADESFGCEWAYRARAVLLCSCSCSAQWPCCAVLCCAVLCRAVPNYARSIFSQPGTRRPSQIRGCARRALCPAAAVSREFP
ncbi:hypothetical protein L1887_53089 [Cichorium endivia]|nr:hypothetical protein L1887_53089 [Cichorium endivia]